MGRSRASLVSPSFTNGGGPRRARASLLASLTRMRHSRRRPGGGAAHHRHDAPERRVVRGMSMLSRLTAILSFRLQHQQCSRGCDLRAIRWAFFFAKELHSVGSSQGRLNSIFSFTNGGKCDPARRLFLFFSIRTETTERERERERRRRDILFRDYVVSSEWTRRCVVRTTKRAGVARAVRGSPEQSRYRLNRIGTGRNKDAVATYSLSLRRIVRVVDALSDDDDREIERCARSVAL